MKSPLISYIAISYNTDHSYFKTCIDSIRNQTYKNIEIIIVDDGSTNDIDILYNSYSKLDKRIKVYYQENSGAAVARNNGINHARGDWIAFIDSDDFISRDMSKTLESFLKKDIDIITFGHTDLRGDQKDVHLFGDSNYFEFSKNEFDGLQLAIMKDNKAQKKYPMFFGAIWNCIYRRSFLIENNVFFISNLRRAQDAIFNLYAVENASKIAYLRENFYYYRIHPFSICHKYTQNVDIYADLINELKKFNLEYNKNETFVKNYYKFSIIYILEVLKLSFFHEDNPDSKVNRNRKLDEEIKKKPYKNILERSNFASINFKQWLQVELLKSKQFYLLDLIFKIYYMRKG